MSLIMPGVTFIGHNYLAPCSLALPHDQYPAHTDWRGSPTQLIVVHKNLEPPQTILAERRSSTSPFDVIVGRFDDDILTLYFGKNGWMGWQSAINLRRPFQPCDIYIRLFFTSFLCRTRPKRMLVIGLGGGIWPVLIRHYFPSIVIDVIEIDEAVIELTHQYFGIDPQRENGHLNVCLELFLVHS